MGYLWWFMGGSSVRGGRVARGRDRGRGRGARARPRGSARRAEVTTGRAGGWAATCSRVGTCPGVGARVGTWAGARVGTWAGARAGG